MKELEIYGDSEQQYDAYIVTPNEYAATVIEINLPNGKALRVQGWLAKLGPASLAKTLRELMDFGPNDDFGLISTGLVETSLPIKNIVSRGVLTLKNGTYLFTRTANGKV